jgi:nucleoside-diphosphate-sugar epimerase
MVMSAVLVTGGSGFVGAHVILQLLAAGHEVRTTLRSPGREAEVRAMLQEGGAEPGDRLRFFTADLLDDAGWAEAVAGCDYVQHVASPMPLTNPKHEDELIIPARDGTLRVLRFARDAGVKRVVVTSSFAAIGYGNPPRASPFDETDWANTASPDVQPYMKSKAVAERAAWDFAGREGGGMELSVVNPTGVFGPALGADLSSLVIIRRLLDGDMPGTPRLSFTVVDVRDVADLHLRAMTHPAAAGERFLAATETVLSMHEIAQLLRARLGQAARRVPRWELPDWLIRLVALRDPMARTILPQLGIIRRATGAKARRLLGWAPRSAEEAILASAESLFRLGLVKG